MIGDKLIITDYHRKAAAAIFEKLKTKLPGTKNPFIITVAGESGCGKSETAAVHKEISRTNLRLPDIKKKLRAPVVFNQLKLIRLRNTSTAFSGLPAVSTERDQSRLKITWQNRGSRATLTANLKNLSFTVQHRDRTGQERSLLPGLKR